MRQLRWPVLLAALGGAVLPVAGIALGYFARGHGALDAGADIAIALGLSYPPVFFLLRHAVLTALVVLAPLPGMVAFLAVSPARGGTPVLGCCLGLGLAVSVLIGDAVAASFSGENRGDRIPANLARGDAVFVAAILGNLIVPALILAGLVSAHPWWDVACAGFLTIASTAVALRLAIPCLDICEDDIARANRAREMFGRFFAPVLAVARPRFGFSVFGIACATATIAFFGTRPPHGGAMPALWAFAALAMVVLATGYGVTRDWRRGLAIALATAPALQIGFWFLSRSGTPLSATVWSAALVVLGIVLSIQFFVARSACVDIATEDDVAVGSERAIETKSMAAVVAGAVGLAPVLPYAAHAPTLSMFVCLCLVAGAVAAVLFQPAIAITLESAMPRAATVAARYRLK